MDDYCLVAEVDGKVIGAVWVKIANEYRDVDDETSCFHITTDLVTGIINIALTAICSIALSKPILGSLVVLGEISNSGKFIKVGELVNCLQVCLGSGARKALIPATSKVGLLRHILNG